MMMTLNKNRIRAAIMRFGKKYYWLTALLVMALFVFFIRCFIPTVYASDLDELKRKCDNLFTGFGMTNFEYMRLVYSAFKHFTATDSNGVMNLRIVITTIGNLAVICFSLMNLAKESQRGIVDIETLKHTNEQLISTLDEVMTIQREGKEKRVEAEKELAGIEQELRNKLMEASHS